MSIKNNLLALNHTYYFWGTSVYVGLLWSLHFIFYPSWKSMTPEALPDHFMVPVNAATAFFTYVVPLMLLTGAILIYAEWKTKQRWICILSYAALLLMMVVGYFLIAPVNESIAAGIASANLDPLKLEGQLENWMLFNDMRCVIMTTMWLIIVYYFISKGNLLEKFSTKSTNES
jgi:hypothetical protein